MVSDNKSNNWIEKPEFPSTNPIYGYNIKGYKRLPVAKRCTGLGFRIAGLTCDAVKAVEAGESLMIHLT